MLSKINQGQKGKCTAAPTPSHVDSGAIDLAEAEETGSHQGGTEEDGGGTAKEGGCFDWTGGLDPRVLFKVGPHVMLIASSTS